MTRGYDLSSPSRALDTTTTGEVGRGSSSSDGESAATAVEIRPDEHAPDGGAASLIQQVGRVPEVRSERVAAVRAAIASGSYHVSASEVAGKLIESMLDFNR